MTPTLTREATKSLATRGEFHLKLVREVTKSLATRGGFHLKLVREAIKSLETRGKFHLKLVREATKSLATREEFHQVSTVGMYYLVQYTIDGQHALEEVILEPFSNDDLRKS